MPPLRTVFARDQSEGPLHYQGAKFSLKSFISFYVSKPEAGYNINAWKQRRAEETRREESTNTKIHTPPVIKRFFHIP